MIIYCGRTQESALESSNAMPINFSIAVLSENIEKECKTIALKVRRSWDWYFQDFGSWDVLKVQ